MKKLRSDKYSRARGGNSKLIKVVCAKCQTGILEYQKDGIGNLRRLYLDRIQSKHTGNTLICENCSNLIGVLAVYKKENRPAFRLITGSFSKKNI